MKALCEGFHHNRTASRKFGITHAVALRGPAHETEAASLQVIEVHCQDNQYADGNSQVEWINAKQVASVIQHSHDQGSDNGPDDTALGPGEAGAANNWTRNRL